MREQATLDALATGRLSATRASAYLPHLPIDQLVALELGHTSASELQLADQRAVEQGKDTRAQIRRLQAQLGEPLRAK